MTTPKNMNEVTELAVAVLAGDYKDSVTDKPDLALTDRCDRCGAQAYVLAVFETGEVQLCGHHGTKHWDALKASAKEVHDFRDRLTASAG